MVDDLIDGSAPGKSLLEQVRDYFFKPANSVTITPLVAGQFTAASTAAPRRDPLVLDLNGNGLETTGVSTTSPILFDHTGTGVRTATGWVSASDGFLVLDRNGNGLIDSGKELFGDATVKSNGQLAADGFDALRDLDSNADGKISVSDAQYANLRIWRDLNQDGVSQSGELFTLSSLNIAAINAASSANSQLLSNGNQVADLGSFIYADGSSGTVGEVSGNLGDINLAQNTFLSQFTDRLDTSSVAHLPDIQGAGQVRSLREAATLSPVLTQLLNNFSAAGSFAARQTLLDPIIQAWSDTSGMATTFALSASSASIATLTASGSFTAPGGFTTPSSFTSAYSGHGLTINMQGIAIGGVQYNTLANQLTVLERFNGRTFNSVPAGTANATVNFWSTSQALLQQSYNTLKDSVNSALLAQTQLKPYLDAIGLKLDSNGVSLDFTGMNALLAANVQSNAGETFTDALLLQKYQGGTLNSNGWNGPETIASLERQLPVGFDIAGLLTQLGFNGGTSANDQLAGTNATDIMYGGNGNDVLYGNGGDDVLNGGEGSDTLNGGAGADRYVFDTVTGFEWVRSGSNLSTTEDSIEFSAASGIGLNGIQLRRYGNNIDIRVKTADGSFDNSVVVIENYFGGYGVKQIVLADGTILAGLSILQHIIGSYGGNGYDNMSGYNDAVNHMYGLAGDDYMNGGNLGDLLDGGDGQDNLYGNAGDDTLQGGLGNDNLYGGDGNDSLLSGDSNDYLSGDNGNDILNGGEGSDTLNGGAGADRYVFDTVTGFEWVRSGSNLSTTEDSIEFSAASGIGLNGIQLRRYGNNIDIRVKTADGSFDNSVVVIENYFGGYGVKQIVLADGTILAGLSILQHIIGSYGGNGYDNMSGYNDAVNHMYGLAGDDYMNGGNLGDLLDGGDGQDNLYGNTGDDTLQGGLGNDNLNGGDGNDTYIVDLITTVSGTTAIAALQDTVNETGGTVGGIDTLQLNGTTTNTTATTLVLAANLENLNAGNTGTSLLNLTGNAASNVLTGNAAANTLNGGDGNDYLDGGVGADSLNGGDGNDIYVVDNAGDVVTETNALASGGVDLVQASISYTLGDNLENLTLTGSSDLTAVGNGLGNLLTGNYGNNLLDGAAGIDTLSGGAGNDTYIVDLITTVSGTTAIAALQDTVIETGGTANGIDTLQLRGSSTNTVTTTLSLATDLENLDAGATGGSLLNLTGNASDNILTGNAAANLLNGGAGADTLIGGLGNDTYVVDLITTGSGVNAVAALHDTVIETGGTAGGFDTLQLSGSSINSVATTLVLAADLENLNAQYTGNSLLNLTGNASANTLSGNTAANTLTGGDGNDTYVVDLVTIGNAAVLHDTVIETGGTLGGIDTLQLSGSSTNTVVTTLTLAANLENLNAGNTGTSLLNLTGNTAANVLAGNTADNTLAGGTGNDSLSGGAGNDKLYGYDVLDSTGATLVNQLVITAKADLLADAVAAKMDVYIDGILKTSFSVANNGVYQTYTVDPALLGVNAHRIQVAYSNDAYIAGPPVQDRNLWVSGISVNGVFTASNAAGVYLDTGSAAAAFDGSGLAAGTNVLNNNGALSFSLDGNDSLDGGLGTDTLSGGLGDDVYVIDNVGDVVIENANAGIDTIKSSFTYNLNGIANIENITLTGTAAINATGTAGVNLLGGNAADNILDGGSGIDSLVGGAGNDTYIVDLVTNGNVAALQDSLYESSTTTNGIDTLQLRGTSSNTVATTLGLSTNLENLDAGNTGNSLLNLTGNASDNRLTGNAANNVLSGGAGNDALIGGAGNDTLIGGTGNDTYQFGLGSGADVIQENDATAGNNDIVAVIGGIDINQLWFRQLGNDLEMSVIGTGDKTTFSNWYAGSAYHVEQISDGGKTLADTSIDALVQKMASLSPSVPGQTTLPADYQTALAPILATSWQ